MILSQWPPTQAPILTHARPNRKEQNQLKQNIPNLKKLNTSRKLATPIHHLLGEDINIKILLNTRNPPNNTPRATQQTPSKPSMNCP